MPNKSSDAEHKAVRTCVICKDRIEQDKLLSFYFLEKDIIFDIDRKVHARKKYVCFREDCLSQINKWADKYQKKAGRTSKI